MSASTSSTGPVCSSASLVIHITARHENIDSFTPAIENFLLQQGIDKKTVFQVVLVLDEAVTNTISYGYEPKEQHDIHITLTIEPSRILVTIEDTGRAFNPLLAPRPELDVPLAQRKKPVGGMGVHFIQACMETMEYTRKNEKNVLIMTLPRTSSQPDVLP